MERTAPRDSILSAERGALEDVFYYITFVCNLRCRHCYVGDNLAPHTHAETSVVKRTLDRCSAAGARRLTFLGGEPTLHPDFSELVAHALTLPFHRVIVDTSGVGRYPVPTGMSSDARLAVRFSV